VLSRDFLPEASRGFDAELFDRAIDVQVSRLRRKLGRTGAERAADSNPHRHPYTGPVVVGLAR
jgi:two-component system, OmpR family, response regulator